MAPLCAPLLQKSALVFILILNINLWNCASAELLVINVLQNVDAVLKCTADAKPGVDYRAARWYKEGVSPRLSGLLSKDLPDGRMRWYVGASTENSLFNQTLDLLLPNVSCSHSGVYQCYLAAPVGEQNREGRVRLTVAGCPTEVVKEVKEVKEVEKTPVAPPPSLSEDYLVVVAVVLLVVVVALVVAIVSCRSVSNMMWSKNKTPGKELFPNPNSPPEKQGLMPIFCSRPSPTTVPAFTV